MADSFDPYHKWLGISPKDQPPNHYRLLAIELFECDPDVIESAADQRMSHVRTFQTGQNSAVSQRLLNELSAAKLCLLHPQKKADYDRQLRQKIEPAASPPSSVGNALRGVPPADSAVLPLPLGGRSEDGLPRALPQARPLPAQEPAPLVVASSSSTSAIHRRTARKPPIWQQPAVLVTAAAATVLAALAAYSFSSGGKTPVVAKTSSTTHTTIAAKSTVPVESGKKAAKDPAAVPRTASAPVLPSTSSKPLELTPLAAEKSPMLVDLAPGKPADVLKAIDLGRDVLHGNWEFDGKSVISPDSDDKAQIQLPAVVSGDYQLEVVAQRESGGDCISFTLPIAGAQATLVIDGYQGNLSGLQTIDGKNIDTNETKREGAIFADGKPKRIDIAVRKNHVKVACDGKPLVDWTGDVSRLKPMGDAPHKDRIYLGDWHSRYRVTKIELTPLDSEAAAESPPRLAGPPVDLLKQIDPKRDAVAGDWQMTDSLAGEWRMEGKELVAPGAPFGNLQAPVTAPDEYTLTLVANCGETARDVMVGLPIDGRHVLLCLDGWTGSLSGLHLIDGKDGDDNETTFRNKVLHEGPNEVACVVRKSSIHVTCNGTTIIQWQGDASRLSTASILKIPEQAYPCLLCWATPYRVSKFELAPLVAKASATAVVTGAGEKTTAGLLKVFEDEPEFVAALTSADHGAEAVLASNEAYSGRASVKVTPTQCFSEALPGLNVKIRKQPTAADEYRFLRFAWKKRGGEQIWLQLHYPGNWFRYRAGPDRSGGWSGVRVADALPADFVVVTRDLAADFGEFALTGIALTPNDGECAWYDHIYLAKTLADFDRIEVSPKKSPERKFADLSAGNQTRLDVPDEAALKEARKQMLTKAFSAELAAAKMPDAKRQLAQQLIKQAAETEDNVALAYTLYRQAADLAEAAGDLDLAWQAIDELARAFAVDEVALRQQSLTEVGKAAKSPEQARERVDDACRLMASALAAAQGAMVKKIATQAQSFAKRSKDGALIKEIAIRTRDANKLAAELEAVAAARDKLKAMPDDPDANFAVGRYEIRAAGDWEQALPKLARGSDADWKKPAGDDLALSRASATVEQKIAAADGWLAMAEKEVWPARHYLRMRATEWLRRAWPSLSGKNRTEAHQRLKTLLAVDDGLPDWKRFDVLGGQEVGGYMHLDKDGAIRTPVEYEGPIDVSFVARTDSTNIRLYAHDHPAVVWNWESNPSILRVRRPTGESLEIPTAPLQPNRWYRFRYAIHPQGTTIWVDGAVVFTENRAYAAIGRSMVSVHGAVGSIVDVKKLVVKPQ